MHQSTSKYKLCLYLFFFIFSSSIFNFQIFENYEENFRLKTIKINGLSSDEKKKVETELSNFLNTNIFNLKKNLILEKLNKFNFLENIYVSRIIPSSININLSKTDIIGKTVVNGKVFYIGNNGNFIDSDQLLEEKNIASVFGNFEIREYLNLLKILNENNIDIRNIEKYFFYKNKRWDLLFKDGLTLKLPSKKVDESMKIYKKLLDYNNLINIKIIDLRVNNQIILTKNDE